MNVSDMAKILNVGNEFFEKNFKVKKIENNTSNSNENEKLESKQQNSTNDSTPPVIKLSDEQTLNMILKITFIILDFVKSALEDSEDDE